MAQHRRAGEVIIWDSKDPLPGRKGRRGEGKKQLKKKENLLIHRSETLPSLPLSPLPVRLPRHLW